LRQSRWTCGSPSSNPLSKPFLWPAPRSSSTAFICKVRYVIGDLPRLRDDHELKGQKLKRLNAAITYCENNREHIKYDEYLAAGYTIGSGVAEGACRDLVKDRMERTGMRWTVSWDQAMLHLRAVYLNGRWDEFIEYHTEQDRLYGKAAA
jgi:hypothetical protein